VVSEEERRLLEQLAPDYKSIEVIPNGIDLKEYGSENGKVQPNSLIFCGSCDYQPNYQGISWFLEKVYPLIKSRESGVRLTVTGNVRALPVTLNADVIQTGFVDDVKPLLSSACVSIVPILSGGGTRLKILESMALGTPVVSTSKGAEGLKVTNGLDLLIGDCPEMFAQSVLSLLDNERLRNRIAQDALRLVQEKYDWAEIMTRFLSMVGTGLNRRSQINSEPKTRDSRPFGASVARPFSNLESTPEKRNV
jgi:glycosyltransferase involved in cell wall biosynthesis